VAYAKAGCTGVCVLGAIVSAGALLFWLATVRQASAAPGYRCAELAPCKTGGRTSGKTNIT
jgi:hypothetical protein